MSDPHHDQSHSYAFSGFGSLGSENYNRNDGMTITRYNDGSTSERSSFGWMS